MNTWRASYATAITFEAELDNYTERDWVIFLLCSLFNSIVLLNLLIAIIGHTFENYSAESVQLGYMEKVN